MISVAGPRGDWLLLAALLPLLAGCRGESSGGTPEGSAPMSATPASTSAVVTAVSGAASATLAPEAGCDTLSAVFRTLFGTAQRDTVRLVLDRKDRRVPGCRLVLRWMSVGRPDPATLVRKPLEQRGWVMDQYYGGEGEGGDFSYEGFTRDGVFCRVRHDVSRAFFSRRDSGGMPVGEPDSVAYDIKGDCMRDTTAVPR